MRNPFHHRQAITDAKNFYGRSSIVRSLLEMIASGQSCALVGERRIGKSSLLNYLLDPRVRAEHDLDAHTLVAYLDFLAFHTASPEELWLEILEALLTAGSAEAEVRAVLEPLAMLRPLPFAELRRGLRRLARAGWRVVLFFDELELAVQNPRFDVGLFGALRSLAGGEGVVFVTASRLGLFELDQYRGEEARRKILGSPFFNIFAEFSLGPFDDHEMAELIAGSLEATPIRFDASDVAWLDHVAGRHPYFLQLAAYHLYAALERAGLAGETDALISDARRIDCRAVAREELARESAKIFRNLWQHSSDAEKSALGALASDSQAARLRAGLRGERSTLERLVRRGLLVKRLSDHRESDSTSTRELSLERYRLFSEVLGEWLRGEGLVGEAGRAEDSAEIAAPAIVDQLPVRYSVLEEIGQGSAGSVFKVWDERLQRVVAVKALSQAVRNAPDRLQQLLGEARICAALNHPHIVTVYDVDVEHGCLITEFFAGGSLRDLLDHSPILPVEDLAALAEQLAGALAAAHRAGVVHRDLKPENVLLTAQPSPRGVAALPLVKLADFGTAQRLSGLPEDTGIIAGTLAYMAPEQRAGREAGPAADLYSLGVVLFEARHGHRPGVAWIDDDTSSELIAAARTSHLESRARELSHRLDAIIARCLQPMPEERFASAEEVLSGLRGGPV